MYQCMREMRKRETNLCLKKMNDLSEWWTRETIKWIEWASERESKNEYDKQRKCETGLAGGNELNVMNLNAFLYYVYRFAYNVISLSNELAFIYLFFNFSFSFCIVQHAVVCLKLISFTIYILNDNVANCLWIKCV